MAGALMALLFFLMFLPLILEYRYRRQQRGVPLRPMGQRRVNVKRAQHEADMKCVVQVGNSKMVCYTTNEVKNSIKYLEKAERRKEQISHLDKIDWGHKYDPRNPNKCLGCGKDQRDPTMSRFGRSYPYDICEGYTENNVKVREELLDKLLTSLSK